MPCAFAQIGLTTTALESVATAVGAGIVLGGALMGVFGLVRGWPSRKLERRALRDGYLGGSVALILVVFDLVMRYVV
jgi:VIT1/CCC1 family predicted Fe2+/Mn2+ transporter